VCAHFIANMMTLSDCVNLNYITYRLKWEAVGTNNTTACVPKPYALSRLPFLSTHAETTTTTISATLTRVIHHEPLLCVGVTSLEDQSRLALPPRDIGGQLYNSTSSSSSSSSSIRGGGPPCPPPTPVKSEVNRRCAEDSDEEDEDEVDGLLLRRQFQVSSGSSQSSLSSPECPPSFPSPPTSLEESSPPNSPIGGASRNNSTVINNKSSTSQPRITRKPFTKSFP